MSIRLSSLSALAAALFLLAACVDPAVLAGGNGGAGGAGGNGGNGGAGGAGGGGPASTAGSGGGNSCVEAGGQCAGINAANCKDGILGDESMYSCGSDVGLVCCFPSEPCANPCMNAGDTRCAADTLQTCTADGACLTWVMGAPCAAGETCNSDATACITPSSSCSADAECGCGCGCGGGMCLCTGAIPPSCGVDADCGPACAGLACINQTCVTQVCTPGMDQTCNDDLAMSALAGTCNADGTCSCAPGYAMKPSGRCG